MVMGSQVRHQDCDQTISEGCVSCCPDGDTGGEAAMTGTGHHLAGAGHIVILDSAVMAGRDQAGVVDIAPVNAVHPAHVDTDTGQGTGVPPGVPQLDITLVSSGQVATIPGPPHMASTNNGVVTVTWSPHIVSDVPYMSVAIQAS